MNRCSDWPAESHVWSALPLDATTYDEAEISRAIEAGEEPETAEAYLMRVRFQARRIPDVMIAAATVDAPSDAAIAAANPLPPPVKAAVRDVEWEGRCLREFSVLASTLASWAAHQEAGRCKLPPPRPAPPSINDEAAWRGFLFGDPAAAAQSLQCTYDVDVDAEVASGSAAAAAASRADCLEGNIEDYPSSEDESDDGAGRGSDGSRGGGGGRRPERPPGAFPSMSIVMSYDQLGATRVVRRMVAQAVRLFEDGASARKRGRAEPRSPGSAALRSTGFITPSESAWLFAFLARLEKPLLADVSAVIRQLFVLCRRQLEALAADAEGEADDRAAAAATAAGAPAQSNSNAVAYTSLRVLTTIAGRHFEQQHSHE